MNTEPYNMALKRKFFTDQLIEKESRAPSTVRTSHSLNTRT